MKILDDLNTLISYPSRSEDGECCKEALGCVLGLAKSFGLETKCGRHGDVGIVELGKEKKRWGFLSMSMSFPRETFPFGSTTV